MPYKVKTRSKWHWKLLLPLLVLVLALGLGAWFVKSHENKITATSKSTNTTNTGKGSIDYSPATPADNAANESRKSSSSGSETLNSSGSTKSNGLSVTILNASVISDSGGNKLVHIGNIVSGTSTGVCTLTASKSGQPDVNDTASVQLDGNNYDCGVFNTPVSKFPSSGTWLLTLTVTSGGSAGSATKSITIN